MQLLRKLNKYVLFSLLIVSSCKAQYPELKDGIYAEFITNKGVMVAKLEYEKVPVTAANFIALAEGKNTLVDSIYKNKKFFDGLTFHRVIKDFMIQSGDPLGNGTGNPGYRFIDEFNPELSHNKKGTLAMANSGFGTNGSQFYITHKNTSWLDAYDEKGLEKPCENNRVSCHAVFGEVIIGLEIIDSIEQGDIIKTVNIIRKGNLAKKFNAPKVFLNHFIEAERLEKEQIEKAEAVIKKSKEKFDAQKTQAIELPSGLKYLITEKGLGKKLPGNASLLAHYAVYFDTGKIIETSKLEIAESQLIANQQRKEQNQYQPITCKIGPEAKMIAGFKEGLRQLSVGDKATLFIPYHLAYGESGNKNIPAKSNLIFEVEVIELLK